MEKQWIEHLRNRFADRKVAPPEGLWKSVCDAMNAGADGGGIDKKRRRPVAVVAMWYRRVVAAAACVAAVVAAVWFFANRQDMIYNTVAGTARLGGLQSPELAGAASADASVGDLPSVQQAVRRIVAVSARPETVVASEITPSADSVSTEGKKAVPIESNENDALPRNDESVVAKRKPVHGNPNGDNGSRYLASADNVRTPSGGMSVSVYGSGLTAMGASSGTSGSSIRPFNIMADPVLGKENMLAYFAYGQAGTAEVKVKHRQPVRLGASVRFDLPGRFGVETGVNYSYHSSDIASGDDSGGYATEQKLHYVGIPVAVNYDIWHTDFLEVYASAGGAVEFCVSGTSHTEYVSNETVTNTVNADVRDSRPQWSVGASAGVQYNFSGLVGVYVEPGVNYYFDNGSGVSTIYKGKPFNFNLNVGLRFTIR